MNGALAKESKLSLTYTLACADMFQLLSQFFWSPSIELAEGFLDGSISNDVNSLFVDLGITPEEDVLADGSVFWRSFSDASVFWSKMRQDYTALFTHPEKPIISLYEMQFRDARVHNSASSTLFLNEAALHAEQCYREAGLVLSDARSREPGDHMALELEFMSYLYIQLSRAVSAQDQSAQTHWKQAVVAFEEHWESWGDCFFAACELADCGVVYPWIGKLGRIFYRSYFSIK